MPADAAASSPSVTDLQRSIAEVRAENARLQAELLEASQQHSATSEVLEVINSSSGDQTRVFETILKKAHALCGVTRGSLQLYDGEKFHAVALHNVPDDVADRLRQGYEPGPYVPVQQLLGGAQFVHVRDLAEIDHPIARAAAKIGIGTTLYLALRKDGRLLGQIVAAREEVRDFSDKEIALLQNFAQQAVIAMENARLLDELRDSTRDLRESLKYQTATSDVLKVISRSTFVLQRVLDTLVESAVVLCEADIGTIRRREGDSYKLSATFGFSPEARSRTERYSPLPSRSSIFGQAVLEGRTVHIPDILADPDYARPDLQRLTGFRAALGVLLRREGNLIGTLVLQRFAPGPFTPRQIELVETFADQAVIAIENARLLDELTRREQELSVTFENMGDGVVMFDADLRIGSWNRNFQELLDVSDSFLANRPSLDDYVRLLVERGEVGHGNADEEVVRYRERASQPWSTERTRPDGRTIEVRNNPVPGGGAVLIYSDITERKKAETEIQAARDAAEVALERQTATADILKVIASSPTDVQPVLDAIAGAAQRFCGAADALISLREGDEFIRAAHEGSMPSILGRSPLDRSSVSGRSILEGRTIHIPDIGRLDREDFPSSQTLAASSGARAALAAPMGREGSAVGCILLRRADTGSFAPTEIELLEAFAAQAVIAIDNVRLFTELSEALEQQTATADILRVISQSPTDVEPVLEAVASAARRYCGATDALVTLREGANMRVAAHDGSMSTVLGVSGPLDPARISGRCILQSRTIHVPDVDQLDPVEFATTHELGRRVGFRAIVGAPMLRDGAAVGSILLRKPDRGAFTPRQVQLLETFAAQAVIAIENVRLFTELRDSLERLKAAQANLIQAEKMASLGQLTAGIAHEIKNPLNFVNNFAGLSNELLDELKQAVDPLLGRDDDKRAEVQETMELLNSNLAKILEHGRRADGIVKSMLTHSRGGTGDWQASNINGLVEEALSLAYHGARAQDNEFSVTLERDFSPEAKSIDVVPQDVTRVLLNLIGNGFYAVRKRQRETGEDDYQPTLKVSTRDLGEAVEIRVRDNGIGVSPDVRDKLFQPFFTTKPTGEGTGLGLSISYDIVTQQHGGVIEVESEIGQFTEFTVRLPRARRAALAEVGGE